MPRSFAITMIRFVMRHWIPAKDEFWFFEASIKRGKLTNEWKMHPVGGGIPTTSGIASTKIHLCQKDKSFQKAVINLTIPG